MRHPSFRVHAIQKSGRWYMFAQSTRAMVSPGAWLDGRNGAGAGRAARLVWRGEVVPLRASTVLWHSSE